MARGAAPRGSRSSSGGWGALFGLFGRSDYANGCLDWCATAKAAPVAATGAQMALPPAQRAQQSPPPPWQPQSPKAIAADTPLP